MDWSLLRSFLAVAETGSLSAAAARLGTTQPTLGRHIDLLEQAMGVTLFHRSRKGAEPTEAALSLLENAQAMGRAADALSRKAAGASETLQGSVRLTASRMVSTFVLPDILAALRSEAPDLALEIVASDDTQNLLRRDADLALRMIEPTQHSLVRRKIADLPLGVYASRAYLARKGTPSRAEDLLAHDLVGFDRHEDLLRGFAQWGRAVTRDFFPLRTDDHVVMFQLIAAGAGLGFALRPMADHDPRLVAVPLADLPLPGLPLWLVMHEDLRGNARIRFVWDYLARALGDRLQPSGLPSEEPR